MKDVLLSFWETHCLPIHDNSGKDGLISAFQKPLSSMLQYYLQDSTLKTGVVSLSEMLFFPYQNARCYFTSCFVWFVSASSTAGPQHRLW